MIYLSFDVFETEGVLNLGFFGRRNAHDKWAFQRLLNLRNNFVILYHLSIIEQYNNSTSLTINLFKLLRMSSIHNNQIALIKYLLIIS